MKIIHIIAVILIVTGFGIIHSKSRILEISGSVCIGIGSLYFIVLLLRSTKKTKKLE